MLKYKYLVIVLIEENSSVVIYLFINYYFIIGKIRNASIKSRMKN